MPAQASYILTEIWNDPDWVKLPQASQWLYWTLLSQQQRDWAGIVPYFPMAWADLSADGTLEDMLAALTALNHANFTVADERTGEVLIRSYMRHNERVILRSPNTFKSAMTSVRAARSRKIRAVLLSELRRLDVDRIAALPSSTVRSPRAESPGDVYRRTVAILEADQEAAPTAHSGRSDGSSSGSPLEATLPTALSTSLPASLPATLPTTLPTTSGAGEDPNSADSVDHQGPRPGNETAGQDAQPDRNSAEDLDPTLDTTLSTTLPASLPATLQTTLPAAKAKSLLSTSVSLGGGAVDLETTPARANAGSHAPTREVPTQDPSPAPVSPPPKDPTPQDQTPDSEPFAPGKIVEDWAAKRNEDGAEIRSGFVVALGRKAEDLARKDPQLTPARLHVALDLWLAAGLGTHQLGMSVDDVIGGPEAMILDPDRKLSRHEIMELRGGEVPQPVPAGWWDQVALREANKLRARWRRDTIARRAARR